jgi:origin recognition complex subunit 2
VEGVLQCRVQRFVPRIWLEAGFPPWRCSFLGLSDLVFHSKQTLLTDFVHWYCTDTGEPHLVVNGYFPSLQIKHVLDAITEKHLGFRGNFRNVADQTAFISEELNSIGQTSDFFNLILTVFFFACPDDEHLPFVLLVHNIDGMLLRNASAQSALGALGSHYKIHIVASVDHINASLSVLLCVVGICSKEY